MQRAQQSGGSLRNRLLLPEILWLGTHPGDWNLPAGALGWGLAHSRWTRHGMLSHLDWFVVTLSDREHWVRWMTTGDQTLWLDRDIESVLRGFPTLHAVGHPGAVTVFRESLLIEARLGCGI